MIILRRSGHPEQKIYTGHLAKEVAAYNERLDQHRFEFTPETWNRRVPFRPKYRRIFHENLETHGRWYSRAQDMTKAERRSIRIDGQPVVELDIASCQMRIVLNHLGHEAPQDAYALAGVPSRERKKYKQAVIIALNCDSRATAEYSLREWLKGAGLDPAQAGRVLDRIETAYPEDVRRVFYSGSSGWAMHLDAEVCRGVVKRFVAAKKPVLAVHDAWLVPRSLEHDLYWAIRSSYKEVLNGWLPVLKRMDAQGEEEYVCDEYYYPGMRRAGGRE